MNCPQYQNPTKHGGERAPAEPIQRRQCHILQDFRLGRGVHLFHEWNIDQVEEIQQSHPRDTGDEMEPAQNELGRFGPGDRRQNIQRCHCVEVVHQSFLRNRDELFETPPNDARKPALGGETVVRNERNVATGVYVYQSESRGKSALHGLRLSTAGPNAWKFLLKSAPDRRIVLTSTRRSALAVRYRGAQRRGCPPLFPERREGSREHAVASAVHGQPRAVFGKQVVQFEEIGDGKQ